MHFAENFVRKNDSRYRLVIILKPYPTILPSSQSDINISEAERESMNSKTPRKPPKARIFQVDELQRFKEMDVIRIIDDIDEKTIALHLVEMFCTVSITFQLNL